MSENFLQSIAQSGSIRQVGALPGAMARAEDPKQPLTTTKYERYKGGAGNPACVR